MKKIIKLTENDLRRIVKRVVKEGMGMDYTPYYDIQSVDCGNDVRSGYVDLDGETIIIDKIDNKGNINESDNRQNKFLDKVIEFIVDDTIINYGKYNSIHFPFFPSSLPFSPHLPYVLLPTSLLCPSFHTYCKDTYGLTDQEIRYLWKEYKDIILDKINDKESINESDNRQNKFLDKVIEFIVDDTIINYENNSIHFPFFPSSLPPLTTLPLSFHPFSRSLPPSFPTYCKDTYGLTDEEVRYVWKEYKDKINNKI